MRRPAFLALTTVVAAATTVLAPTTPATASRTVTVAECAQPGSLLDVVPWPRLALAPERAWTFTAGAGITVAVLDSGVDAHHPQLAGRVLAGYDAVTDGGRADDDCVGTGTQVAGVIAARPANGAGFAGVAPDVTILPIRVVDDTSSAGPVAEPAVLARGIDAAVSRQADVIAISAVAYTDDGRLRGAVANALGRGVTVVAAVGNLGEANAGNPPPFPAAYPGVIGVGAIDMTGKRWSASQYGGFVDLVAPGAQVPTLQRGSGMALVDGTGVACGFVAATAALVRARWGSELPTPSIADVLTGTATPGATGPYYGHGMVNPYAAVANQVVAAEPGALPPLSRPDDPADDAAAVHSRTVALAGASIALLATLGFVVAAFAVPRGRRRFWRGTLARRVTEPPETDTPGPPGPLFDSRADPHLPAPGAL